MSNRTQWIDEMRGFLIVCVVIGHFSVDFISNRILKLAVVESIEYIYLFHMPIFLILSVLLQNQSKGIFNNIKSSSKIFVVYLLYCLAKSVNMLEQGDFYPVFVNLLMGNYYHLKSIIWFLPCLISLRILCELWLNDSLVIRSSILFTSALTILFSQWVMLHHNFIPWGIDIALYVMPIGILCRTILQRRSTTLTNNKLIIYLLALLTFSGALLLLPVKNVGGYDHRLDLAQFNVAPNFLAYIALSAFIIFFIFSFYVSPRNKFLSIIGRFSFPIFILHLFFLNKLGKIMPEDQHFLIQALSFIAIVALSVVGPMVISLVAWSQAPKISSWLGLSPQGYAPSKKYRIDQLVRSNSHP